MEGEKIGSLNFAVKEALPAMKSAAAENPNAEVLVRVLKFSSGAQWLYPNPEPVDDFKWSDLRASGVTDMGRALSLVAEELRTPPMPERALPPVLVLLSDGQPTDDFEGGLSKLMGEPWGKKAVRIAIHLGGAVEGDCLQRFIGNTEQKPLVAKNSPALVDYIKWASTAVVRAASTPASQPVGGSKRGVNVPIPEPPAADPQADDVW